MVSSPGWQPGTASKGSLFLPLRRTLKFAIWMLLLHRILCQISNAEVKTPAENPKDSITVRHKEQLEAAWVCQNVCQFSLLPALSTQPSADSAGTTSS